MRATYGGRKRFLFGVWGGGGCSQCWKYCLMSVVLSAAHCLAPSWCAWIWLVLCLIHFLISRIVFDMTCSIVVYCNRSRNVESSCTVWKMFSTMACNWVRSVRCSWGGCRCIFLICQIVIKTVQPWCMILEKKLVLLIHGALVWRSVCHASTIRP